MNKESPNFVSQQQNEINGTCLLTQDLTNPNRIYSKDLSIANYQIPMDHLVGSKTVFERPAQIRFGNHFAKMGFNVCFVFYDNSDDIYKTNIKTYKIVNMIHHRSQTKIFLDVRFSDCNFSNIVEFNYNGYQNVNWMNLQKEMFNDVQ